MDFLDDLLEGFKNRKILNKLKNYAKNSIELEFDFNADIPCGGSKFGGRPDVPQSFVWESYNGKPLSFIAQFDLAEAAKYDSEGMLPKSGTLSFFYELETMEWGYDPKTLSSARVYYFPPEEKLSPAEFPEELEDDYRFTAAKIVMKKKLSYPCPSDDIKLPLSEDENDEYFDIYNEITPEYPDTSSKLLGHPNLVQGAIGLQCELVSRNIYTGSGYPTITDEMRKAAEDWILLFQLDSFDNENCPLMFGDAGRIYWYIQKDDLKNKRFDKAQLVLQCG